MVYQIVSIICGLIAPRFILTHYGSTYNGVISSITQLLGVISILTLGIAGATRVAYYKTLSVGDKIGTSRIYKANQLYLRKVALGGIVYTLVLTVMYPVISHNDLDNKSIALLVLILGISTFAEYFFTLSNSTILTADQSGYISTIVNIVARILNTVLIVLLILNGYSIFIVYLASSIVFFLAPMIIDIIVKRKYEIDLKCEPDFTALEGRGAVAFHSIANIVHSNTDLVVLTLFTDAKVISIYTVYYLVVGKVKSLMSIFSNGMEGAFGDMWAKNQKETLKRSFTVYEYILYMFSVIVFSCVSILIVPFVNRYVNGVTDVNYLRLDFALLVTVTEALYCIRQPYLTLVQATGNYEATKMGALLEALINIIISVLLVWKIGLNGVVIGTLIANLIRTNQFAFFVSKQILDRNISEYLLNLLWAGTTGFIIYIIAGRITGIVQFSPSWIGWVYQALITFFVAVFIALCSSIICKRRVCMEALKLLQRMLKVKG